MFTITEKEILTDDSGNFNASILGRADLYTEGEYLGFEDISIKMKLTLAPPVNGKKWYLQIEDFKWKQINQDKEGKTYGK